MEWIMLLPEYMVPGTKNPDFGVYKHQRCRPAFAQTDRRLCYSPFEKYHIYPCCKENDLGQS